MRDTKQTKRAAGQPEIEAGTRKTYQKIVLRCERIVEASAPIGKVQTTQSGCHQDRKTS